ncbi:MAG: hypothetical protein LBT74_06095 [Acidobacteriota bacterium]|jgi:uncharacterized integral membrane protein|nr:hypothetical protein [Acidobacteriota bacterium]
MTTRPADAAPEERPPVFKTWRGIYLALLGNLLLLIMVFYLITKVFS